MRLLRIDWVAKTDKFSGMKRASKSIKKEPFSGSFFSKNYNSSG